MAWLDAASGGGEAIATSAIHIPAAKTVTVTSHGNVAVILNGLDFFAIKVNMKKLLSFPKL